MSDKLVLAVPSKGRLMEKALSLFSEAGLSIVKTGHERGYRGRVVELDGVEVAFLSASEIAFNLREGEVHLGITGEDLLCEQMSDMDARVQIVKRLGFGHADVIVAVPEAWLDVRDMADLDEVAVAYHSRHGRRLPGGESGGGRCGRRAERRPRRRLRNEAEPGRQYPGVLHLPRGERQRVGIRHRCRR